MSECRSCHAEVRWVEFPSGKKNPLDPRPVAGGNIAITGATAPSGLPVALALTQLEIVERIGGGPLYISHFTTCPHSRSHRR